MVIVVDLGMLLQSMPRMTNIRSTKRTHVIHLTSSDVRGVLSASSQRGKRLLPWQKRFAGLPFNILEDAAVENEPEVHKREGDLWFCLEGEVRFVYGGALIGAYVKMARGAPNKNELGGKAIKGGAEAILQPGDWLWIPPSVPHQHSAGGTARLVIIKIR